MSLVDNIHSRFVQDRRSRILSEHLANIVPLRSRLLDVGSGDGLLSKLILKRRPDITIQGLDVLVRLFTHIATEEYDGKILPYFDDSFDGVLFADVLHHTTDPMILLREAKRVARNVIVIKDHLVDGLFAPQILRFMDRVGNARYGVSLPNNYWSKDEWFDAFNALGLKIEIWTTKLGLYPRPATWIFDRSLHFIARLEI